MMLRVVSAYRSTRSDVVDDLLDSLDREFGSDVLTGSYNKSRLLFTTTKNTPDMCAWVLETLLLGLRRGDATKEDFILAAFQKHKDTPNFMEVALAKRFIIQHLISLKDNVASIDNDLGQKLETMVTSKLLSPSMYAAAFPVAKGSGVEESDTAGVSPSEEPADHESNFIENLRASAPRGVVLFAEVFKNTYDSTDKDACDAIHSSNAPEQLFQNMDPEALPKLSQDLKEAMDAMTQSDDTVAVPSMSAPKASLRDLCRKLSDGGGDENSASPSARSCGRKPWQRGRNSSRCCS